MMILKTASRLSQSIGLKRVRKLVHKAFSQYSYRAPTGPNQALSTQHFEPVRRERGNDLDQPCGGIYEQWSGVAGGHKWLHYFEVYDELFAGRRERPIRMLEIGVYRGASLETWHRALAPGSVLVGIDINPGCQQYGRPTENVHVRIGSQSDAAFLTDVTREFGPFDVILDDGSHLCSHMIASFNQLFLTALTDDGIYITEDTHTNYWPKYRDQKYSFVDLCKDLVDVMHSHYTLAPGEKAYRIGHADQVTVLEVPRLSAQIKDISFRDSIIAIRKKPVSRLPATIHV